MDVFVRRAAPGAPPSFSSPLVSRRSASRGDRCEPPRAHQGRLAYTRYTLVDRWYGTGLRINMGMILSFVCIGPPKRSVHTYLDLVHW